MASQGELAWQLNPADDGFLKGFNTSPWVLAISLGDADQLTIFKGNGNGKYGVNEYPHPAMVTATSAFNYNLAPVNGDWQRPILYTKAAWTCNAIAGDSQNFPPGQSFLEKKYGSIAALNAAWGSNYTSFCDAGGFGTGTGVLDEDGRHTAWFGTDFYNQTGMNAKLKADLDQYLYSMAYLAYAPQVNAIRSYDTNHLLMCGFYGGSGAGGMRTIVAQAFHDAGCQVMVMTWNNTYNDVALASSKAVYDQTGMPATVWYGGTAQVDSDMSNYPNNGAGYGDYTTQEIRGQHYNYRQPGHLRGAGIQRRLLRVGSRLLVLDRQQPGKPELGLHVAQRQRLRRGLRHPGRQYRPVWLSLRRRERRLRRLHRRQSRKPIRRFCNSSSYRYNTN